MGWYIIKKVNTKKIVLTGILFAVALTLSFFESLIPTSSFLPPGVKLGLSNIVTMYSIFVLGAGTGISIVILKGFFVFITRGVMASLLSMSGGLLSVLGMVILSKIFDNKKQYLILSIFGAIFHNVGQIIIASIFISNKLIYTLPILILSGIFMGIITGIILKTVLPYIDKLSS